MYNIGTSSGRPRGSRGYSLLILVVVVVGGGDCSAGWM